MRKEAMRSRCSYISVCFFVVCCFSGQDARCEEQPVEARSAIVNRMIEGIDVEVESDNKFGFKQGYTPEGRELGSDEKPFTALRHEGFYTFYFPKRDWPEYKLFMHTWTRYKTSSAIAVEDQQVESRSVDDFDARFQELFISKGMMFNDPRFNVAVGLVEIEDEYGLFWGKSFEQIKLILDSSREKGFFGIGKQFSYYGIKENELIDREKDIFNIVSKYEINYSKKNWLGAKFHYQNDSSSSYEEEDPLDFDGYWFGAFGKGFVDTLAFGSIDYHAEFIWQDGEYEYQPDSLATYEGDISSWAFFSEIGKIFSPENFVSRVAIRYGITDKPDSDSRSFFQTPMRTNQVKATDTISYGLIGSAVSMELENAHFYSLLLQFEPATRSTVDVQFASIFNREEDSPFQPLTVDSSDIDTGSNHLGYSFNVRHKWIAYPFKLLGKRSNFIIRNNLALFQPGDGLKSLDRTVAYVLSISLDL
ncbi:MAG: hypothetical protein QNK36_13770 [Colwellia sp.]|nr:hypothetical protein [Colwellia sp.]